MEGRGGRDSSVLGLISSRMPLLEVDWPSAIPSLTGLWKIPLITLPSTTFPTTHCTPRDILPSVMPRTPSPSQRTAPPNLSTSSSRETRPPGSTTPPSVRDDSLDSPTRTDPPRPSAVSTLPAPNRPSIAICGRRARSKALPPTTRRLRLLSPERRPSLPYTLHGANSAREWKMNFPSMRSQPVFPFTNSAEMRSVTLSRRI
mmetsp:Transcript_23401/g.29904  ORF Transcript_23401/g.29904 Transcript_23401/m.29904 type:complete len:202 (-) Transcript_23401:297-902(-)